MIPALSIEIPLPHKVLSQNGSHGKPVARSKARQAYKKLVAKIAREAMEKANHLGFLRATVAQAWYMAKDPLRKGRYRPLDEDNARGAMKYAIDGCVEAGVVPFDDHKTLKHGECVLYRTQKEHEGRSCVVLTFTDREEEAGGE